MQRFMPGVYDVAYTYESEVGPAAVYEASLVCTVAAEHPSGCGVNGVGELDNGARLEVILSLGDAGLIGTWVACLPGQRGPDGDLSGGPVRLDPLMDERGVWTGRWRREDGSPGGSCTIAPAD